MKATKNGVGMTEAQILARNFSSQRVVREFSTAGKNYSAVEIVNRRKNYSAKGSASVVLMLENGRKVRVTYEMV